LAAVDKELILLAPVARSIRKKCLELNSQRIIGVRWKVGRFPASEKGLMDNRNLRVYIHVYKTDARTANLRLEIAVAPAVRYFAENARGRSDDVYPNEFAGR